MSLYETSVKIGGVPCGLVTRGGQNGQYQAVFEREYATLEQIEGIRWDEPEIEGECVLPAGYGFAVEDIAYSASGQTYTVELRTARQYLGDVTGYQNQIAALSSTIEALQNQSGGDGAVVEQLAAAYQEGVESNG